MLRSRAASAIKPLVLILLLIWGEAQAAPVGRVTNLSGPLFAMDAAGTRRILSIGSQIEPGETLITEDKTYAQIRFIDKGVVTLKPGTQLKIESFGFEEQVPEKDNAVFGLLKGALRKVTGLIGKRGNQDAYRMVTPTATIGIRGTQFLVQFVPELPTAVSRIPLAHPLLASLDTGWIAAANGTLTDVPTGLFVLADLTPPAQLAQAANVGGLPPGTYLHVIDGLVNMSNPGGSQLFTPGQFGLAGAPNIPPIILPSDPGIGRGFTPPPSFHATQQQAQQAPIGESPSTAPPRQPQQNQEGCEVR